MTTNERDPSASAHFAFQELVNLARADRQIRAEERQTLDRFARHLGIDRRKARRYQRLCRDRGLDYPSDPARQIDLLQMLARVAYSDGVMQPEEEAFFERIGDELEISRVRLANVLADAEARAQRHRHLDRRWLWAVLVAASLAAAMFWMHSQSRPDEMTGFKPINEELRRSLVLLHTRYTVRHPGGTARRLAATGTGFFVSSDGLLLTNKHVVQPWRFPGKGLDLLADGYEVDEASVESFAWREGDLVLDTSRRPLTGAAFATSADTLEIVRLAPDAERPRAERPAHLRDAEVFCHASDDGDLALLRCAVRQPVPAVTLAGGSRQLDRLDPVLVVGYPRGLHLLETRHAESSPVVGRVRKNEHAIWITAPLVGGNSGGPLIDTEGRVVGIATRTRGDATLAACICVECAHDLIR